MKTTVVTAATRGLTRPLRNAITALITTSNAQAYALQRRPQLEVRTDPLKPTVSV
jgi:hypothetical protein